MARPDRSLFPVRRHRSCRERARTAGEMDDRRYDCLPGGSGPQRAKHKERPPPRQDVRSLTRRPFWRLAAVYSLLLLHPPTWHHGLGDGASAFGWSLGLAICRNRHGTDSLLHHRAPESKVLSEAWQADRQRRKQAGRPHVVFSRVSFLFFFVLAVSSRSRLRGGSRESAGFWFACSFYTLDCVLRVDSN